MPVLTKWLRVVLKGTGPNGEIWQTGFSAVQGTPAGSQSALQTASDAAEPIIKTFWDAVKIPIFSTYAYTGIDVYQYDGGSTTALLHASTARTPVPGGKTTTGAPVDTACVLSLRTSLPGRSGRGRMFLPCHDVVTTAGVFSSTAPSVNANAFKTMANSLAVVPPDMVLCVASRTKLAYNVLNKVVCDDKPDVLRSRVDRLAPVFVTTLSIP